MLIPPVTVLYAHCGTVKAPKTTLCQVTCMDTDDVQQQHQQILAYLCRAVQLRSSEEKGTEFAAHLQLPEALLQLFQNISEALCSILRVFVVQLLEKPRKT